MFDFVILVRSVNHFLLLGIEHRHSNPPVGMNIQPRPTHLGLESTPPRKQSSVETKTDYGKYRYLFHMLLDYGASKLKANFLYFLFEFSNRSNRSMFHFRSQSHQDLFNAFQEFNLICSQKRNTHYVSEYDTLV